MRKEKFKNEIEKDQYRLQRIYEGDESEFNKLYKECRVLINIFKSKYSSIDVLDIESAFSEACYICYANIRSGKLRLLKARLIDYIRKVMNFKLYDKYKNDSKYQYTEEEKDWAIDAEEEENIKMRVVVNNFVKKIKEPCKTILEKFYLDGLSYDKLIAFLPSYTSIQALKAKSYKCKKEVADGLALELKRNDIGLNLYK